MDVCNVFFGIFCISRACCKSLAGLQLLRKFKQFSHSTLDLDFTHSSTHTPGSGGWLEILLSNNKINEET